MSEKSVDEKKFKECCDLMLSGRMHPEVAAYLTGLSRPTFYKRVKQFYDPEKYGELPEDFFSGEKTEWNEDPKWIKHSAYVQQYIANQKAKEERKEEKAKRRKMELKRDRFLPASRLPRLGD